jgi:hypothetical protein
MALQMGPGRGFLGAGVLPGGVLPGGVPGGLPGGKGRSQRGGQLKKIPL